MVYIITWGHHLDILSRMSKVWAECVTELLELEEGPPPWFYAWVTIRKERRGGTPVRFPPKYSPLPFSRPGRDCGSKQPWQAPKEATGQQYLWSQHQVTVPPIFWTPTRWGSKDSGKVQESAGAEVEDWDGRSLSKQTEWNKKKNILKNQGKESPKNL